MAGVIAERENVIPLIGEVFRTYGFEGASLARISEGTKLGKGSIYHCFPGGKEEMAEAVLAQVDMWFKQHVFEPLVERADAIEGIKAMFDDVNSFTFSGRRVCLAGVFALGNGRDRFTSQIRDYFSAWIDALTVALERAGRGPQEAKTLAQEAVGGIQGAIVLARGLDRVEIFADTLRSLEDRLLAV